MESPWATHGLPWDTHETASNQWDPHGSRIGDVRESPANPWEPRGGFIGNPLESTTTALRTIGISTWDTHGISIGARQTRGALIGLPWKTNGPTHEKPMGNPWEHRKMHGSPMGDP